LFAINITHFADFYTGCSFVKKSVI